MHEAQAGRDSKWPEVERLTQVYGDGLRLRVWSECLLREISPKMFQREVSKNTRLSTVVQAFELLEQYGWIERRRSDESDPDAVEHFYRGLDDSVISSELWVQLPDSTKALVVARILETFAARTKEAMKAGTIWARNDAHLTWSPLGLDRQGWDNIIAKVNAVFLSFEQEQAQARARMAESGEAPIPMTVALMAFESPEGTELQP